MFYEEEIRAEREVAQYQELLSSCDLGMPKNVDFTLGIFDENNSLAAAASLVNDMIQGVAVDPKRQGEDLTGRLFTGLIRHALEKGISSLYLFTKPEKAFQFEGLGFRTVVNARPHAALLEWGRDGIDEFVKKLRKIRQDSTNDSTDDSPNDSTNSTETQMGTQGKTAAIVMNCNPFTKGHRYLIEQAAAESKLVYVIVVEENKSMFAFEDRLEMVKRGTADLENVVVLSGGRYAVSSLTFPSYFTGEEKAAAAHTAVDAEIFLKHIAPALDINCRYVGSEPYSPVTAIYNETLKEKLPKGGVEVIELKRLEIGEKPVSASEVRSLIPETDRNSNNCEGNRSDKVLSPETINRLKAILPNSTFKYLQEIKVIPLTLMDLLDSRENRVKHQKELLEKYCGADIASTLTEAGKDNVADKVLISMTLNIPGAVKDSPEYRRVLREGMKNLKDKLCIGFAFEQSEASDKGNLERPIIYEEIRELITGPEGYLCVNGNPLQVKKAAIEVEEADSLGRLLDIDVITKDGGISRSRLGAKPRTCLLCDEDAKVCARGRRHEMSELLAKIEEIIKSSK